MAEFKYLECLRPNGEKIFLFTGSSRGGSYLSLARFCSAMEPVELANAVRRAVRTTIAAKVSRFLSMHIPLLAHRAILTIGTSILLVGSSSSVAADLSLSIATSTLLQGVTASGSNSLPLTMFHLCSILEAGNVIAPLVLGNLGNPFLENIQYLFASAVADSLLLVATPSVALAGAVGLASISSWGGGVDSTLAVALAQSSTAVLRTMLLQSIPPSLQLVSITGILVFIRPLYNLVGVGEPIYTFALYQTGGALQSAFETEFSLATAAMVAITLSFIVPIPVFRIVSQIAAVGSFTDWVVSAIQEAADVDPFPSLLSILLFSTVLLSALREPEAPVHPLHGKK